MANLNNEHLEMICELQYKDLRVANMGRNAILKAQDLIKAGIAEEKADNSLSDLAPVYLHLTEKGQSILEQLELELNKAVMI